MQKIVIKCKTVVHLWPRTWLEQQLQSPLVMKSNSQSINSILPFCVGEEIFQCGSLSMIIALDLERSLWYERKTTDPRANYILKEFGPGRRINAYLCTVNLFIKVQYLHGSLEKEETDKKSEPSRKNVFILRKIYKSVLLLYFIKC